MPVVRLEGKIVMSQGRSLSDLVHLESGPCWQCGDEAPWTCDTPGCGRWVCHEHTVVEAQAWDVLGADGVDIRCR